MTVRRVFWAYSLFIALGLAFCIAMGVLAR